VKRSPPSSEQPQVMKAARVFQLAVLALAVVSAVQAGYWLFDLRSNAIEKVQSARVLYQQQIDAAQALLDGGASADRVQHLLPGVLVVGGRASLAPDVDRALLVEEHKRVNQYAWEGAFFLLALALCIAVISRALRAEAKVLQEQDNFLALVSHQFKTPLASLQLSLETMAMRPLSPDQSRTLIDRMLSDLARMEAMVTQILESVRLERGRVDLRKEPIEIAGAVARIIVHLEERAKKERVTISSEIPRGIYVLADPLAIDVVVRNLLENAISAVAPIGGGTITVAGRRVDAEVELSVRDSGVGFKPADGARLFEKFTRLHPGGGSSYYGTGLGLFIVRRLMQLAGGRVSAHSEGVGRGAQFTLAWPAAQAEPTRT
jgi:signal transduction histidine kinase